MPVNRNALIRYKTIDQCLRNRYRKWTLDDLIDACSDALYEYEGIDKGVSRRTVQMDIQMMRSDKLGYHAPIVVIERKYYTYSDPEYSITNIPLTKNDLGKLSEVVDILKQFKGFTHFQELQGIVQKLEDKIHISRENERPVIDLEKNEDLRGLEYIDPIFQAIVNKKCIRITYQSFKARQSDSFNFHPALLKEFRNRWFVLGKKKQSSKFLLLALDRIQLIEETDLPLFGFDDEQLDNFFKNVVGVTVNQGEEPKEIKLFIDHFNAPYIITKPMHHSQKVIEKNDQGIVISLFVQPNFELDKEILALGDHIKVISPARLKSRIKERLSHALDLYDTELNQSSVQYFKEKLDARGHIIVNRIYTKREINRIGTLISRYRKDHPPRDKNAYSIRSLVHKTPDLVKLLLNKNLLKILRLFGENLFLTKAIYFHKAPESNWYVTWHQDKTINVPERIDTPGFYGWTKKEELFGVVPPEEILHKTLTVRIHLDDTTQKNGALRVLPGSHKKLMNSEELRLITENSMAYTSEVREGGIQLMKPLLIHASSKSEVQKKRRVIHLEFNSEELPNNLRWGEFFEI